LDYRPYYCIYADEHFGRELEVEARIDAKQDASIASMIKITTGCVASPRKGGR
jgi:hypothetical protein